MPKIIVNDVENIEGNPLAAALAINENGDNIEAGFENTLSRDGSGPNQMEAVLDMNGHRIINLAAPQNLNDAARLQDVVGDGTIEISPLPSGGSAGQVLTKQSVTDYDAAWDDLPDFLQAGDLADVAFSGDYDDLSNKPIIPTIPTIPNDISDVTYITVTDQTGTVPNSRRLVASTNVSIDLSTPGEARISSTASGGGSGVIETIVPGTGISVDSSDPANPIVSATGGGGTPPTLRGTSEINGSASSLVLPLPAGSAAGDLAIIQTSHAYAVTTPAGWTVLDSSPGTQTNGATFTKVLSSGDVSTGSVTVSYSGSYDGYATMAVFTVGTFAAQVPILLLQAVRSSTASASQNLTIGPLTTNCVLVTYGGSRDDSTSGAITPLLGTNQQNHTAIRINGSLSTYTPNYDSLFRQTVSFAASANGYYTSAVVVMGPQ